MTLQEKVLALTGSFETSQRPPLCFGSVTGNFDGQGMSMGALQFNFGQGTLQPILKAMVTDHWDIVQDIFGDQAVVLRKVVFDMTKSQQIAWADSVSSARKSLLARPWRDMFSALGQTKECQALQVKAAQGYFNKALKLVNDYGLSTERAVALMFDIAVQNGSISSSVRSVILKAFKDVRGATPDEIEVSKMRIVAIKRAEAANPGWIEDVKARKLCIANGSGIVHGMRYDLAKDFDITLRRAVS